MTTQIEYARSGILTQEIEILSQQEGISQDTLSHRVKKGSVVIMNRNGRIVGIGKGLCTKVNVNIGTSGICINPEEEIKKAVIAEKYGADTLSDLSMGGQVLEIRRAIGEATTLPITTVPIYQAAAKAGIPAMDDDLILRTIEEQVQEGINSVVLHTITEKQVSLVRDKQRILGVVSKGGSIMASYMHYHQTTNPNIRYFSEILEMLKERDVVLSLGNSLRSGCIHDKRDSAQEAELKTNIRLAKQAHEAGIQTIIEWSGGHVRADRIEKNIRYYKKRSRYPVFVAGPLPTDVAVGHDHMAGCVGASIASGAGVDYLCYITPSEHLGLPDPQQVKEGLMAYRIAAHIGDSMKYGLFTDDLMVARSRRDLDWEGQFSHALDPEEARKIRSGSGPCTMCGDFCAIRLMEQILK